MNAFAGSLVSLLLFGLVVCLVSNYWKRLFILDFWVGGLLSLGLASIVSAQLTFHSEPVNRAWAFAALDALFTWLVMSPLAVAYFRWKPIKGAKPLVPWKVA